MTLLPVIGRELRAVARQSFTYLSRVLAVMVLLIGLLTSGLQTMGPGAGGQLFAFLHLTLFFAIWFLVPLLTADSISRERREGTLPLLFLTSLQPFQIVYAKGVAHGLRAFSLWLAAVPVLTICFVAGGVAWTDVLFSVCINFSSICLALAAGLVASSISRIWTRAMAMALFLTGWFLLGFLTLLPFTIRASYLGVAPNSPMVFFDERTLSPDIGFALAVNWDGTWHDLMTAGRAGPKQTFLFCFIFVALISLGLLLLLIRLAAWNMRRTWQEGPPAPRVVWLREKMLRPVAFQPLLKRWLRWELQRNPIGWLERRSWSGRLVVWSWFAVVACFYSSILTNLSLYQRAFHGLQVVLATLLAASMGLSAAGSFRRERDSGVLELLLVAPLREWQIISGRVRGLWSQFMPAVILLCVVWLYCGTFLTHGGEGPAIMLSIVTFTTLPVIGLYFSLAQTNFMAALIWTLGVGMLLPILMGQGASMFVSPVNDPLHPLQDQLPDFFVRMAFQITVAMFLAWRLHENLKWRRFVVQGGG